MLPGSWTPEPVKLVFGRPQPAGLLSPASQRTRSAGKLETRRGWNVEQGTESLQRVSWRDAFIIDSGGHSDIIA